MNLFALGALVTAVTGLLLPILLPFITPVANRWAKQMLGRVQELEKKVLECERRDLLKDERIRALEALLRGR